jgi:hypothetical protein
MTPGHTKEEMMRKILTTLALAGFLVGASAVGAQAAPLPSNCDRIQGTVICTTFEGPGNNQAGVGSESVVETKGNTTNKNPEPQDLKDECEQNPTNSNGKPIVCPEP